MSDTTPPERVKVVFAQNGNIRLFTIGDIPASLAELPVYEYVRSDCNADCVSGLDCDALIKQAVADAVIASEARAAAAERERDELRAALRNPPKHVYWGAGEPDCPRDIIAGNGELHTLRCKVCGKGLSEGRICLAGLPQ